jgi:hypothetical protein
LNVAIILLSIDKQKLMNLRNISIKINTLYFAGILICTGAMHYCFVLIDIKGFKDRKAISSTAMAKVLGFNSISAIEFLDNAAANKIL